MRYIALIFFLLSSGCGGDTGQGGDPDASEDTAHDPLVPDGPCGPCDDSDPCTMDLCNTETLTCVFLPLDMDFDGHLPTECDGDDCDDTRPDVYAGAREICLDGVDQDCDTLVDGPMVMGEDVRVSEVEGASHAPAMAWTGSEFALVWHESLVDAVYDAALYFVRLRVDGEPVTEPIVLAPDSYGHGQPSLVWAGSRLGLAWTGDMEFDSSHLQFSTLSPTGEFENSIFDYFTSGRPKLAWTGSRFGLSAASYGGLYFAVLAEDAGMAGTILEIMDIEARGNAMGLAWSGSEFAVAWEYTEEFLENDIHVALISASGETVSEPNRITDAGFSIAPELAWAGSEFGLAWIYGWYVYFSRITPMGTKEGGDVRISRFQSQDLRSTWTGSEHALAWLEGPDLDKQVAVSLVQADGDIHWEPLHVSGVGSDKDGMALAWTGSELGLAWGDARDSDPDCGPDSEIPCVPEIYFNRVGFCE